MVFFTFFFFFLPGMLKFVEHAIHCLYVHSLTVHRKFFLIFSQNISNHILSSFIRIFPIFILTNSSIVSSNSLLYCCGHTMPALPYILVSNTNIYVQVSTHWSRFQPDFVFEPAQNLFSQRYACQRIQPVSGLKKKKKGGWWQRNWKKVCGCPLCSASDRDQ